MSLAAARAGGGLTAGHPASDHPGGGTGEEGVRGNLWCRQGGYPPASPGRVEPLS